MSIGTYLPAAMLLAASFTLTAIGLWMQSETIVSPPEDEKSVAGKPAPERSTSIGFPLGVVAALHALGFLVFASFDWIHKTPKSLTPVILLPANCNITDCLYFMPYHSIRGDRRSTHPPSQSTLPNIQLPNPLLHRQSSNKEFLPPRSRDVSLHPLNPELLPGLLHRSALFSACLSTTPLKNKSPAYHSNSSTDDYRHGTDKSVELVLFRCQARVRTICHGVGESLSVRLENMGGVDTVGLVVYLVACVGGRIDCPRCASMISRWASDVLQWLWR